MNLPASSTLPVEHLAAAFGEVTNSYKFYWFMAILDQVRQQPAAVLPIHDLLVRMIASAWYPASYFRLSFGKQDRLGQAALQVGGAAGLSGLQRQGVVQAIQASLVGDPSLARLVDSLGKYVPYRFLRPFFARELRGLEDWKVNQRLEDLAQQAFSGPNPPCLYRFAPGPAIEIHPQWLAYLAQHIPILSGFCLWNLANYLQKHNPNVPNIGGKLFEPSQRDLAQARKFWRSAFERIGPLTCIYSGQGMPDSGYSLDHFLPWRFVAHDLLWNIVPAPRSVNSSKSDVLPDFERYFDPFTRLQFRAVQAVAGARKSQLLEDHLLLLDVDSLAALQSLPLGAFQDKLHKAVAPQFQIAANMGFSTGWVYA
jgi:hypothetical protein